MVPPHCKWDNPTAARRCRERHAPLRHRTAAAVSVPAEKERARIGRNASSKATGHRAAPHTAGRRAPTGHKTIHKGTMRCEHYSNHQMRRTPSEPLANTPPPPSTRCPRTPQGRELRPARREVPATGVATGRDQPTVHGTVHVVRGCEILIQGVDGWDRRGCATGAPRSANRQGEEQHKHTERGSHTRRDKGEHSRQGGGAQQGRRGNQNSGNREPEWSGWESMRMGGSDNKGDGLAS